LFAILSLTYLDLDIPAGMKRPYMDEFLAHCYTEYDLAVWSQTSWRWLETKLTELGMLTNPHYKICFVLDKTSMFSIKSTRRKDGRVVEHHVKPLDIIWSKYPRWSSSNTCHVDDLRRNFALNPTSGIYISPYYRKKSAKKDAELLGLYRYLLLLAAAKVSFDEINFDDWQRVVSGDAPLLSKKKNDK
jgi:ubiquitin-like domain-containing CTD phosphatase 1